MKLHFCVLIVVAVYMTIVTISTLINMNEMMNNSYSIDQQGRFIRWISVGRHWLSESNKSDSTTNPASAGNSIKSRNSNFVANENPTGNTRSSYGSTVPTGSVKVAGETKGTGGYVTAFGSIGKIVSREKKFADNVGDVIRPLFIVVVVFSAPANFRNRQDIRATWGTIAARRDVTLYFAMGRDTSATVRSRLADETLRYDDLWIGDFEDTYRNLTRKSIMMLEWVTTHHPDARYVLKIDDDCFLNPYAFFEFISKISKGDGRGNDVVDGGIDVANVSVIYGSLSVKQTPVRDQRSKYYVSQTQFAGNQLPTFIRGPSYLMSRGAVAAIVAKLETEIVDGGCGDVTSDPFPLEDVYITGVCAQLANVSRVNQPQFSKDGAPRHPDILRQYVTFHHVARPSLFRYWTSLHLDGQSKDKLPAPGIQHQPRILTKQDLPLKNAPDIPRVIDNKGRKNS